MLPDFYKFRIENRMGAQIDFSGDDANNTFVITAKGWKFNSSGALVYSSELTLFADPSVDLADLAAAEGAEIDNTSDLFLGLEVYAILTTDCANAGRIDIYWEFPTDGSGGTYPSDAADLVESEDMKIIRSIIHPGGGAGAPDVKAVNFSL